MSAFLLAVTCCRRRHRRSRKAGAQRWSARLGGSAGCCSPPLGNYSRLLVRRTSSCERGCARDDYRGKARPFSVERLQNGPASTCLLCMLRVCKHAHSEVPALFLNTHPSPNRLSRRAATAHRGLSFADETVWRQYEQLAAVRFHRNLKSACQPGALCEVAQT